ncbi:MAG: 3'-5' exonuclease [Bacteroidota bacterium]
MNYIIFDLEATCWEHKRASHIQEIIEIGACKINQYAEMEDTFCEFIKPVHHPTLSPFCKDLTSIRQEDVERAAEYPEVVENFKEWIGLYDNEDYLLCSWGYFDRKALAHDCDLHGLDFDWTDRHISLKHQYPDIKGLNKPMGLKRAVLTEGFEFEGTHHRGIDDAINLAKVFAKYFDDWRHG